VGINTKGIGNYGEDFACQILKKLGYKILSRNFYTRFGEIDIITKKDDEIIFVEVKTRTSRRYGLPVEAVTKIKMARIEKSIQYYLMVKNLKSVKCRVEIFCITGGLLGKFDYYIVRVE